MGRGTVRLLLVAVVVMGVLIVGGTAALIALVAVRGNATPPTTGRATMVTVAAATLVQPAGTRIAAASGSSESLVLVLQGGGPDRVLVVDPRSGQVMARLGLAP